MACFQGQPTWPANRLNLGEISTPSLQFTQTTNNNFLISEDGVLFEGHFPSNILDSSEVIADGLPTSGKHYWELETDVKLKGPRNCYVRYTTGVVRAGRFHVDKPGRRPWGAQLDFGSRCESEIGYGVSTSLSIPDFLSTASPEISIKVRYGHYLDWEKQQFIIVDCIEDKTLLEMESFNLRDAIVAAVGIHVAFDVETYISACFVRSHELTPPSSLIGLLRRC